MTTFAITWPLFIESLLRMALTSVDTLMLSRYADEAVAAVGMLQQFTFFIMVIYMMGATGSSIHIAQNLGAGKEKTATEISRAGIVFNLVLGLGLSVVFRLLAPLLLHSLGTEELVESYAREYLYIYTIFSVFQAVSLALAHIIRSYGYSKTPMYVNMGANALNAIGNYLFIFGPFGIPVLGVTGVAISTVVSQGLGMLVLGFIVAQKKDINLMGGKLFPINRKHIGNILRVGIPSAGEHLSYNMAQIAILYVITALGTAQLAAYSYHATLNRFNMLVAITLGQATQILVGHLVGAKQKEEAFRLCRKNAFIGVVVSFICVCTMSLFRFPLLGILTQDPEIVRIAALLMVISIAHETIRPVNLIVIAGLRGAGDVRFPVIIGMIVMWGVSVSLSWILGISLAWGMVGVWIARILDEWIRGGIMLVRWHRREWQNKTLVRNQEENE